MKAKRDAQHVDLNSINYSLVETAPKGGSIPCAGRNEPKVDYTESFMGPGSYNTQGKFLESIHRHCVNKY